MRKRAAIATVIALAVAGCGGATRTVSITTTAPSATTPATTASPPRDEVLAVPTVGRFYGRCPRASRVWTLRFIVPAGSATDSY